MRFGPKAGWGLLLGAVVAALAGFYVYDSRQLKPAVVSAKTTMSAPGADHPAASGLPPPAAHAPQVDSPAARQKLPPSHPPLAGAAAPRPRPSAPHPPYDKVSSAPGARAGSVQVDASRPYAHFRVGNNSVIAIHADGDTLWLGTSGGIVRYNTVTQEFKTYDGRDGLLANGILYLGGLHGKIAVGTYGGGLSLLDRDSQRWEHYNVAEGLGDAFVYDVLRDSAGNVWIATGSGVNRVQGGDLRNPAKWRLFTVENTGGGLPHNRVFRLVEDKNGGLWFATRGGLANFRKGKWLTWTHEQGLGAPHGGSQRKPAAEGATSTTPDAAREREARGKVAGAVFDPNHIAALEVDRAGQIWAGTRGAGLARYDGRRWVNYTMAEGLPDNHIAALNFDREGRLWIGTRNGLALFDDGKFQVLTTAHGLLGQSVLSVIATEDGGIWAGGFGGVAHIRRPAVN